MAHTFDGIEMRTRDGQSTCRFYESLFGWKVIEKDIVNGSPVRILDTGGVPRLQNLRRAGVVQADDKKTLGILVYVHVGDLDRTLERALELGATEASPREDLPGGYAASFRDLAGTCLRSTRTRGRRRAG